MPEVPPIGDFEVRLDGYPGAKTAGFPLRTFGNHTHGNLQAITRPFIVVVTTWK
jgi:hypothetical protein